MKINFKTLISLPVVTESGLKLGKVYDLNIDTDNHSVIDYLVRKSVVSKTEYVIRYTQVKSINIQAMIVDDVIVSVGESENNTNLTPSTFEGAAFRIEE